MNKKIFDWAIALMSAVGTFYTIAGDCIFNCLFGELNIIINALIRCGVIISILIIIIFYKEKLVNLVDILDAMGRNNKLHALRLAVMLNYEHLNIEKNKFRIKEANFKYELSKIKEANPSDILQINNPENKEEHKTPYNVCFSFDFRFAKPWRTICPFKQRTFSFYLICKKENIKNTEAKIKIDDKEYNVIPSYISVTTRGESGDHRIETSGLQKVQFVLPIRTPYFSAVRLTYSYNFKIEIDENTKQYNFIILPKNYAKKIKEMNIMMDMKNTSYSPVLQFINIEGNINIAESFSFDKSNVIYKTKTKVVSDTVYFIQLNENNSELSIVD